MSVGTWRPFLDEVVLKGARAYALRMLAIKAEHQAKTDLGTSRTRLGSIAAVHTLVVTALGKIATHITEAGTALAKIVTHAGEADTALDAVPTQAAAIATALANALTELGKVNTDLTSANDVWAEEAAYINKSTVHLEAGEPTINKVNLGREVADLHATYAQREVDLAALWDSKRKDILAAAARHVDTMNGYFSEAVNRLELTRRYIEEAGGRVDICQTYIAEADQRISMALAFGRESELRISEMATYIGEAEHYQVIAEEELQISDRYRAESDRAMKEFLDVLADRAQYRTTIAQAALRQPR